MKRKSKRSDSHFYLVNKNNILSKSKRSQSEIVSTVLLVLITIVAAGLIMAFVIPFIKDKLPDKDQNCLNVISKVKISSGYTCYNSVAGVQSVQIKIEDIRDLIKGFTIELGGSSSKAVKALEDDNSGVVMYGGEAFELPNNAEERTYNISISPIPTYIAVHPVLKDNKLCEASDIVRDVENC